MPANSEPVTSLSIARHTLQIILRAAIDAEAEQFIGLIGCKSGLVINQAVPITDAGREECADSLRKNSDLRHILETWETEGITPCGMFFTVENGEIPDHAELERMETAFKTVVPQFADNTVIHMPLLLNTAGCLEAFAYQIHRNLLIPIPLTLAEDGQSTKNG